MATLKIQSDYIASAFILSTLYFGYAQGCRSMIQKSSEQKHIFMTTAMAQIPLFTVTLGLFVEQSPLLAKSFKQYFSQNYDIDFSQELIAVVGFLTLYRIGVLTGKEMIGLYSLYGREKTQKVIAFSYIGALFAGLLAAFYSFHQDHLLSQIGLVALINVPIAFYFLTRIDLPLVTKAINGIMLLGACATIYFAIAHEKFIQEVSRAAFFSSEFYIDRWKTIREPRIESHMTPFQRIDIARFKHPHTYFQLYLNEDFQFDSEAHSLYHKPFIKGPIRLSKNSSAIKKVLILGGGDGLLAAEVINELGQDISITMVELDPEVVHTAIKHWPHMLNSVFIKNVNLDFGDAFNYLRRSSDKFDAILMDFPDPKSFDLAKLYSLEIYNMARSRLNPDGFLVLDYPQKSFEVLFSTLKAAGFVNIVGYGQGHAFIYADPLPLREDLKEKIEALPFPVQAAPQFRASKVNSIFQPTLPTLNFN
jgi:spermidine synthase